MFLNCLAFSGVSEFKAYIIERSKNHVLLFRRYTNHRYHLIRTRYKYRCCVTKNQRPESNKRREMPTYTSENFQQ